MLLTMQGSSWAKEKALLFHSIAPFSLSYFFCQGEGPPAHGVSKKAFGIRVLAGASS